jgi:hypothetical protein
MGEAWEDLVRAHREYLDARARLFAGDPTPQLRRALAFALPIPAGRDAALQALREVGVTRPDIMAELVPELFELALGLDHRSGWVRQMLAKLEPAILETRLAPIVQQFVEDESRDASEHWGLIELLDTAGLVATRAKVIDSALRSTDSDTRLMAQKWVEQLNERPLDYRKA